MKKTLVIIPTYNEIENIESIIHEIFKIKLDLNILVVDEILQTVQEIQFVI